MGVFYGFSLRRALNRFDNAAAKDQISVVKDCGLSWRNGTLRLLKVHSDFPVVQRSKPRRRWRRLITDFYLSGNGSLQSIC